MHRRLKNWTHPSPTATAASVPQYPDGYGNKPVTYVSLAEARLYCTAVGKRLVHEWEWQLAAQGLDGRRYPWGRLLIECRASPFIHTHTRARKRTHHVYRCVSSAGTQLQFVLKNNYCTSGGIRRYLTCVCNYNDDDATKGNTDDGTHCPPQETRMNVCPGPADVDAYPSGASPFGVLDMVGNVWQYTDEYIDDHSRGAIVRGGSNYYPSVPGGTNWYILHRTMLIHQYFRLARGPLQGGPLFT